MSGSATATMGSPVRAMVLRQPDRADGMAIHQLIQDCPPLDLNSGYAYLVLAEHFAQTCILAETADGEVGGFISGYLLPERPDTLFVWQVAVHERARGQGLAQRMLAGLLARPACRNVRYLETTVSPSNQASRQLFQRFADSRGAELSEHPLFERRHFGAEAHEDEPLLRIGPLADAVPPAAPAAAMAHQALGPPLR